MRKKIEELRNREEGFTLVELLAVIVILGIIVALAIPAVGTVVDTARSGATKAEQELVIDAARLYELDEKNPDIGEDKANGVTVGELVKNGYLELSADSKIEENDYVRRFTATEKTGKKGTYGFFKAAAE